MQKIGQLNGRDMHKLRKPVYKGTGEPFPSAKRPNTTESKFMAPSILLVNLVSPYNNIRFRSRTCWLFQVSCCQRSGQDKTTATLSKVDINASTFGERKYDGNR